MGWNVLPVSGLLVTSYGLRGLMATITFLEDHGHNNKAALLSFFPPNIFVNWTSLYVSGAYVAQRICVEFSNNMEMDSKQAFEIRNNELSSSFRYSISSPKFFMLEIVLKHPEPQLSAVIGDFFFQNSL
jgi:hypothetical protein